MSPSGQDDLGAPASPYRAGLVPVTRRRQVKNVILRAPLPLKGTLVAAAWRGYEHYVSWRERPDAEATVGGLPVPPPRLRMLVAGTADRAWFLESGHAHTEFLRDLLDGVGQPIPEMTRILDFGCGCGRMLRWWEDIPSVAIHGCDYNPSLVGWCNANLEFAEVRANRLSPPLPYPDEHFDLLYALSIFTHLTTELAERWLAEMHRVIRPGGMLWFTTHGESLIDRLSPAEAAEFAAGNIVVHFPEVEGMNLCAMFWPEAAVRRMLGDRFELISRFDPVRDRNTATRARLTHDAYLVRRR